MLETFQPYRGKYIWFDNYNKTVYLFIYLFIYVFIIIIIVYSLIYFEFIFIKINLAKYILVLWYTGILDC